MFKKQRITAITLSAVVVFSIHTECMACSDLALLTDSGMETLRSAVRHAPARSEATIRLLADRGFTYYKVLELMALHPSFGGRSTSGHNK